MRRACEHAMAVARDGRDPVHDDKLRYRRDAFFSVRLCLEAVDILMGVAGSSGLYLSGSMQRLFRDSRVTTVAAGSSQMQRNLIANLMGLKVQ